VVWIPAYYPASETYTNVNNVPVFDMRGSGSATFGTALQFSGVPTGSCTASQTGVNTLTGDYYACVASAWIKVGPGGNPGVLVSPVITPNPLALDVDLHFKGPTPWQDITRYGARVVTYNSVPAIPGITANISSGSPTATISAASTFQNGDGVVVYGAGAAHSMTTPGGLTVTPSLAASGTGTGLVVNGITGGTTFNYQIIARNKQGGMTAAGSVVSTTTGSTLGRQSVNITSISKSGLINTVVTATAHGLAIGAMVYISGTSDDLNFGSWFVVATTTDNTHFTYANGRDSANGAATSATGGTVAWFNCNHLAWTAVPGAFQYYIYGRTGGSLTLLGVSVPDGQGVAQKFDDTWDDFGSPYMDNFTAPYYVPTTPPGSATSNNLVTTISSGAGTTTLTLANNAGTTVSAATILFDNATAIMASIGSFGTPSFTPNGSFVTNSYLTIPASAAVLMDGNWILNDSVEVGGGVQWYGDRIPKVNGAASFAYANYPTITANRATPGVYVPSPSSNVFTGLTFNTGQTNNALMLLMDAGTLVTISQVNFISGGTDYMNTGFRSRTDLSNNSLFLNVFRDITITAGQLNPSSATPMFGCMYCGTTDILNVSTSGRAFHFGNVTGLHIHGGRYQGGGTPFLMVGGYTSIGGTSSKLTVREISMDTTGQPLVSCLTTSVAPDNSMFTIDNAGVPSATFPNVAGAPVGNLLLVQNSGTGQNTNTTTLLGGSVSTSGIGGVKAAGTSVISYLMPAPAAPTVQLGGGGSCVANCVGAGSVNYQIAAIDVLGLESLSPIATASPDGTQTVTVSWTPIQGQVSTRFFRGGNSDTVPGSGHVATSFVDGTTQCNICNGSYSNSGHKPGGTSSSISSFGAASGLLNLSPVLFANLGTPGNGTFVYCSDCAVANPCTGSSTGAFAKRLNGVWVCN
jgi:hypothetical protein